MLYIYNVYLLPVISIFYIPGTYLNIPCNFLNVHGASFLLRTGHGIGGM